MITSQVKYFNFDSTFRKSGGHSNPTFQMPILENELNFCSVTDCKIPKIYNITDQLDQAGQPMNRINIYFNNGADVYTSISLPLGKYTIDSLCIELTRLYYNIINDATFNIQIGTSVPILVFDQVHPEVDNVSTSAGYETNQVWIFAMYALDSGKNVQDLDIALGANNVIIEFTFSAKLLNLLGADQSFVATDNANPNNISSFISTNRLRLRFMNDITRWNPVYQNSTEPYNYTANGDYQPTLHPDKHANYSGFYYVFLNICNMNYYSNIFITCPSQQIITNNNIPGFSSNQVIAIIDTSSTGFPFISTDKNNLLLNMNRLDNKGSGDITFEYHDSDFSLISTYGTPTMIRLAFYNYKHITQ